MDAAAASDPDFAALMDQMLEREKDQIKQEREDPSAPELYVSKRKWTRVRPCDDMDCNHAACKYADEEAEEAFYDPERLRRGAFNPNLRYPGSRRYLAGLISRLSQEERRPRPWPEGRACMPTESQARVYVKIHPELLCFFYELEVTEIKRKGFVKYRHFVRTDIYGPCLLSNATKRGQLSWEGVDNFIGFEVIGALMNDILTKKYNPQRALEAKEASPVCHDPFCISKYHRFWV